MEAYFVAALMIVAGLQVASSTYRAGLRQFGYAMGVTAVTAPVLLVADQWVLGVTFLLANFVLFLGSRRIMQQHKIGPFAGK